MQFHHRLDVDVGLTGTGFHLDVEIRSTRSGLAVHQLVRQRQVPRPLNVLNIV